LFFSRDPVAYRESGGGGVDEAWDDEAWDDEAGEEAVVEEGGAVVSKDAIGQGRLRDSVGLVAVVAVG
jgi:hypothetical protein